MRLDGTIRPGGAEVVDPTRVKIEGAEVYDPTRVKIEPGIASSSIGGTKRCAHCNHRLKRTKRKKISN
jgi:hypothetical protein